MKQSNFIMYVYFYVISYFRDYIELFWWLKLNLKFENLSLMGFNMKFEVL